MNEREQAVLDAARGVVREAWSSDAWADRAAAFRRLEAALDALASVEPAPEVVRSVDDLRDGEKVLLWGEKWQLARAGLRTPGYLLHRQSNTSLASRHVQMAVAAGAVTRLPAPEPDPAEVERLASVLFPGRVDDDEAREVATRALRAGVRLPERQS